ncbi:pilus assembly protein CpaE [Cellulosimicrobium marinum]|uniref:pilus assembly protein CpaE n=1 Tax=Cellulosimicrobium marinum TaxID=1638992 RepID=UPI001E321DF2|nr:pilus assembly protein CpaE [Cellulosimicrobium marinum]MCB7135204.1 pilus assembly protein CpaE [Cellulosimicrobium marinum]
MISWDLALALRDAGLRWSPASGDRFRLLATGPGGDLFTVSDMTIEPHEFDTGVILGFNGTTEWALDSVALEDALWHPTEGQLRDLLRSTFRALRRTSDGYVVEVEILGAPRTFDDADPAGAYGRALLELVARSR